MRNLFLIVVLLASNAACDNTKRCRAIAETREIALQPDDRLYFEKKCEAYRAAVREQQRQESERQRARAAEHQRELRWRMLMSENCFDGGSENGSLRRTPECEREYKAATQYVAEHP